MRTLAILEKKNLTGFFDNVLCCDDVKHPKPAPDMLQKLIAFFNVSPEEAIMVGDAEADIASAQSAGVDSVLATWGRQNAFSLERCPDFIVKKPAELFNLVVRNEKNIIN